MQIEKEETTCEYKQRYCINYKCSNTVGDKHGAYGFVTNPEFQEFDDGVQPVCPQCGWRLRSKVTWGWAQKDGIVIWNVGNEQLVEENDDSMRRLK